MATAPAPPLPGGSTAGGGGPDLVHCSQRTHSSCAVTGACGPSPSSPQGIPVRVWCWPGDTADSALIRQVKDDMWDWTRQGRYQDVPANLRVKEVLTSSPGPARPSCTG